MGDLKKRYADGRVDGLSDLNYELLDVQLRPLYTWIHVNLNGMWAGLPTHLSSHSLDD